MAYKQWDPAQLSLNTPNLPVVSHHYLQIVFSLALESVPIGALHGQVSAALSNLPPPTHTPNCRNTELLSIPGTMHMQFLASKC